MLFHHLKLTSGTLLCFSPSHLSRNDDANCKPRRHARIFTRWILASSTSTPTHPHLSLSLHPQHILSSIALLRRRGRATVLPYDHDWILLSPSTSFSLLPLYTSLRPLFAFIPSGGGVRRDNGGGSVRRTLGGGMPHRGRWVWIWRILSQSHTALGQQLPTPTRRLPTPTDMAPRDLLQ